DEDERGLSALAAGQLSVAVRLLGSDRLAPALPRGRVLGLAGDALAAGGDLRTAAQQAVLVAVEASGAAAGALWRPGPAGVELAAARALPGDVEDAAAAMAADTLANRDSPAWRTEPALPAGLRTVASLPLGQPPSGVLHLFFVDEHEPSAEDLAALSSFAARSAHALRQGAQVAELGAELERMRAVLQVTGAASSELSLSHTLETAVERVSALLRLDRLGLYLTDDDSLRAAAGRSLPVGHLEVAAALLAALVGPLRARRVVHAQEDDASDPALGDVRNALRDADERSVVGVPLLRRGEAIGLLAAWPRGRDLTASDRSLLEALAGQLAVSVQNARLHEQAQLLSEERSVALETARDAGRRLTALYEISNAFAETPSLERTADAIVATIAETPQADAAVLRVPAGRGAGLAARPLHVADERHRQALHLLLTRPQPVRLRRSYRPELIAVETARRLGGAYELLVPFLERGSTA